MLTESERMKWIVALYMFVKVVQPLQKTLFHWLLYGSGWEKRLCALIKYFLKEVCSISDFAVL